MIIVTMMTEKYVNLFHYFHKSFRRHNQQKIICYCINFTPSFKKEGVEFVRYDVEAEKETDYNPQGVYKVTHLKSYFLKSVVDSYRQNVLWIDCSKLITGSIDFIDLNKYDWVGIKRNTTKPTKIYFAGLFGFNANSKNLKRYKELCFEKKDDWFNDQRALNEIDKTNHLDLDYSKYVSGERDIYNPKYLIVRALAYEGMDKFEAADKYFYEILKEETSGKKNILAFMHKPGEDWCFLSGIKNIQKHSEHNITLNESSNNVQYFKKLNPDIIWSRGGIFLLKRFLKERPDLKGKIVHTVTHGGELLFDRIDKSIPWSSGTLGVITQNTDAKVIMEYELRKRSLDIPVYVIPNAIDTSSFQPVAGPEEFTVGFVGRNAESRESHIKGYRYFKTAVGILNVKNKEATNSPGKRLKHEQMPAFYNSVSCLVLPSLNEGCSNTTLEAQASGLPVITLKVGYHGEVGKDFEDIIFCTRSVHDIVEKIRFLKDNPAERKRIGGNARKFAEKHSSDKIAKEFDKMFNELQ